MSQDVHLIVLFLVHQLFFYTYFLKIKSTLEVEDELNIFSLLRKSELYKYCDDAGEKMPNESRCSFNCTFLGAPTFLLHILSQKKIYTIDN